MSNPKLRIRKRSGQEVDFDVQKIIVAINKANNAMPPADRLDDETIRGIAANIETKYLTQHTLPTVEAVQDDVVFGLMKAGAFRMAKDYMEYRSNHSHKRSASGLDKKVMAIVGGISAVAKEENANKDPDILPTQRDYIAGEVSRELTMRYLLPPHIVQAHNDGVIHFHDADYAIQHSGNCCLVNMDDILQNGTVITGTMIEKPHRFSTACNIATQVIAQVASSQYGFEKG